MQQEKKIIGVKMKRKSQNDTRVVELLLHNDRPVLVNLDKFLYAMTNADPQTDVEFTRLTLEGGVEVDVQEKMHEVADKLN